MRFFLGVLTIILLVQLAGCGSGGPDRTSTFIGSWAGHWNTTYDPTRPYNLALTVEPDGHASGTVSIPNVFPTSSLYGTISPTGQVDLSIGGINPPPVPSRVAGKLYINASGNVFGSLLVTDNGMPSFVVAIDLARQ